MRRGAFVGISHPYFQALKIAIFSGWLDAIRLDPTIQAIGQVFAGDGKRLIQRRNKVFLVELDSFILSYKIDILGMPDPLKTDRQKQATVKDHTCMQRIGLGDGKHQGMDSLPE